MAFKKHVAAAASAVYTFLELQNMYPCHADSSSTYQTKLCDMILHETIDIQKREDANRCTDPSKCINDQTLRSDTEFCRTSLLKLSDKCPTKSSQVGVRVSTLR